VIRLSALKAAIGTWLALVGVLFGSVSVCVASPVAPAGRAWELVSPVDKGGVGIEFDGAARASVSGNQVGYATYAQFARDGGPATVRNHVISSRGLDSWVASSAEPPYLVQPTSSGPLMPLVSFSDDLRRAVNQVNQVHPTLGGANNNLSLLDVGSSWTVISRPVIPLPVSAQAADNVFAGGSLGFDHVVFESQRALLPEVTDDPAAFANDGIGSVYLYEWFGGQRRLVSVLPPEEGGGPVLTTVGLGLGNTTTVTYRGDRAVSDDGSRIFFSTNTGTDGPNLGPQTLYVRRDADLGGPNPPVTIRVDTSEHTDGDPDDDKPSFFQAASADGTKAFFISGEKLTNDAKATRGDTFCIKTERTSFLNDRCDLYLWDGAQPERERLVDLTVGDADGAAVLGVVGASGDGSRVYFVAAGDLGGDAREGEPNLYLWQQDEGVRYIATLDGSPINPGDQFAADARVWNSARGDRRFGARVSGNGRVLVFRSKLPQTAYDTNGHFQIYAYDAVTRDISCVSCNPRTSTSAGDAALKRTNITEPVEPWWVPRNLSDDARRVVFDSPEALVASDVNNKIDVYERNLITGELQILSGGTAPFDAAFVDASASGSDIFFVTRAQLACQDTDFLPDLYDARQHGGLGGCDTPPACHEDGCQGPATLPPTLPNPASTAFHGQGNNANASRAKAKPKRKAAKRCRTKSKSKAHMKSNKRRCKPTRRPKRQR
jgi:hypothetical protein